MLRWAFLGLIVVSLGISSWGASCVHATDPSKNHKTSSTKKGHKRHKHHHKKPKKKSHHSKKKSKKRHSKVRQYSVKKIEELLKNDHKDGNCNRLNCSSNLGIAKLCLQTRMLRQKHRSCFRAFCAYGCNEEDYISKPEIFEFCNQVCSSRKYGLKWRGE